MTVGQVPTQPITSITPTLAAGRAWFRVGFMWVAYVELQRPPSRLLDLSRSQIGDRIHGHSVGLDRIDLFVGVCHLLTNRWPNRGSILKA